MTIQINRPNTHNICHMLLCCVISCKMHVSKEKTYYNMGIVKSKAIREHHGKKNKTKSKKNTNNTSTENQG